MIVTREKLIRLSESFIQNLAQTDRGIICAYLTGSILNDFPFIDGTTDVDIIIVHTDIPNAYREIKEITSDVTLDIYHYPKEYFSNTRNLRLDPWIGSSLTYDPIVIYGKGHWFEFVHSSVEANFFLPENILERSLFFYKQAQKNFAQYKKLCKTNYEVTTVYNFFLCVENAVNAIACLSNKPLSTRRFFRDFEKRCESIENFELYGKTKNLILGSTKVINNKDYILQAWGYYVDYFAKFTRPDYYPEYGESRINYYQKPASGLWTSDPISSVWIILYSWTQIMTGMKIENNEHYHSFVEMLGLDQKNSEEKIVTMEHFLDNVTVIIDQWGKDKGIQESTEIYTEF